MESSKNCCGEYIQRCWQSGENNTWKVSKYGVFSGPYFPVFGLNTEIYGVIYLTSFQEVLKRKVSATKILEDEIIIVSSATQ